MDIETHLTKIAFQISQAEARLALIRQKMKETEQAGMYPAIPTERWKDDRYLYLYFPDGARGLKLDAKQRLYVGADSAKVEEARRLAANRRLYERLMGRAGTLGIFIDRIKADLSRLASEAERWQREDDEKLLGLESAGQPGAPSPNGLGPEIAGSSGASSPNLLGSDTRSASGSMAPTDWGQPASWTRPRAAPKNGTPSECRTVTYSPGNMPGASDVRI